MVRKNYLSSVMNLFSAALIYKHTSVSVHYKDHCSMLIHNYIIYIKIVLVIWHVCFSYFRVLDERDRHKHVYIRVSVYITTRNIYYIHIHDRETIWLDIKANINCRDCWGENNKQILMQDDEWKWSQVSSCKF